MRGGYPCGRGCGCGGITGPSNLTTPHKRTTAGSLTTERICGDKQGRTEEGQMVIGAPVVNEGQPRHVRQPSSHLLGDDPQVLSNESMVALKLTFCTDLRSVGVIRTLTRFL